MSDLPVRPELPASSDEWDALQDYGRPHGRNGNTTPDFTALVTAARRDVLNLLDSATNEDQLNATEHVAEPLGQHRALTEAIATLVSALTARLAADGDASAVQLSPRRSGHEEPSESANIGDFLLAERLLALLAANDAAGMKSLLHDAFQRAERAESGALITIDHAAPIERTSARLTAAVAAYDPLAAGAVALVIAEVAAERAAAHQRTAEKLGNGFLPLTPATERKSAREAAAAYARLAIGSAQTAARRLSEDRGPTGDAPVAALLARLDADTARGLTAALATDLALASLSRAANDPVRRAALERFALLLGAAVAAKGEASRGVAEGLAGIALKPGGVGTVLEVAETLAAREPALRLPLAEMLSSLFDDVTSIRSRAGVDDKARLADLVLRLAGDGIADGRARNPNGLVRLFSGVSDYHWPEFSAFVLACDQAMAQASHPVRMRLGEALLAAVIATLAPTDVARHDTERFTYETVSGTLAALVPAEIVLASPTAQQTVAYALTRLHGLVHHPFAQPDHGWLQSSSARLAAILASPDGARLLLPTRNGVDAPARRTLLRRVLDNPSITVDRLSRLHPRSAPQEDKSKVGSGIPAKQGQPAKSGVESAHPPSLQQRLPPTAPAARWGAPTMAE